MYPSENNNNMNTPKSFKPYQWYFQGDGAALDVVSDSPVERGIPEPTLMDGGEWSAEQLISHYFYTIKTQKVAWHHLLSDAEKARDYLHLNMMDKISCVTSVKFFFSFIYFLFLILHLYHKKPRKPSIREIWGQ